MRIAAGTGFTLTGSGFTLKNLTEPIDIPSALREAGVVRAPRAGLDELSGEWIYRRAWTLRNTVELGDFPYERAMLSLPGLRGRGEIRIDGERVAAFDGGVEVDVTGCLPGGRVEFEVIFAPQEGTDCRPFGLDTGSSVRGVNLVHIREWNVQAGGEALRSFLALDVYSPGRYTVRYALEQDGEALGATEFEENIVAVPTRLEHMLEGEEGFAEAAHWRAGRENAPVNVRLLIMRRGVACDSALLSTGLRTLQRATPAPGLPACLTAVEGERVALLGACYEPDENVQADVEAVVRQAKEAGMTALYVAGQARDAFYRACDAQGMLLCQQLPLESKAARKMIGALCAHPCIVQWSAAALKGAQGRTADAAHPQISALVEALGEWADERPFIGPVPAGAAAQLPLAATGRRTMVHAVGPSYPLGPELTARYFNQDDAPYRTMRLPALMTQAQLRRVCGGYPYWPVSEPGIASGALWTHRGGITPPFERAQLYDFMGEEPDGDAETISALTRFWQAEAVRYALEQARAREAFGLFAQRLGASFARLSDDVLLDTDGRPRPSYRAFAHAMRPVHVCARLERTGYWPDTRLEAFARVLCAAPSPRQACIEAALYKNDGSCLARETMPCTLLAGEYGRITAQLPGEPCALVLRLTLREGEDVLDESDQTLCVGLLGPLWPLAHLPRTVLRLREGRLTNAGTAIAHGVSAPGLYWRALLPGETVECACAADEIECMNAVME